MSNNKHKHRTFKFIKIRSSRVPSPTRLSACRLSDWPSTRTRRQTVELESFVCVFEALTSCSRVQLLYCDTVVVAAALPLHRPSRFLHYCLSLDRTRSM